MPRLTTILALLALTGLLACPKPGPSVEPDGGEGEPSATSSGAEVPAGAIDPGAAGTSEQGGTSSGGSEPVAGTPTGSCRSDADCLDGGVCEGQGCGDTEPGTCAPRSRMCTRDSRPYCGCDGQTFRASGSCPGRRYAHAGECSSAP